LARHVNAHRSDSPDQELLTVVNAADSRGKLLRWPLQPTYVDAFTSGAPEVGPMMRLIRSEKSAKNYNLA
jgi:hypothetical protein